MPNATLVGACASWTVRSHGFEVASNATKVALGLGF